MQNNKWLLGASLAMAFSTPALAVDFDAYGSLRLGVEAVAPDGSADEDYSGFRDAYSRVGVKVSEKLSDDWTVTAQLEIPLDLANFDIHSPYDQEDKVRIAKIQVTGPLGTLWYGTGWMAYYNNIAYPVDFFSSYYSGWATLTTFRRAKTLYYSTPAWNGLSASIASTDDNPGVDDNRNQYVLSYSNNGFTLAGGLDDNAGSTDTRIWGAAATYTKGPWYLAGKYEVLDTVGPNDGKGAKNLLVQYSIDGKNTVRGMIADVDAWSYGDTILHIGWDHQYNDKLKVFLEYYSEESTAAISQSNDSFGPSGYISGVASGGSVITTGVRYDFSL